MKGFFITWKILGGDQFTQLYKFADLNRALDCWREFWEVEPSELERFYVVPAGQFQTELEGSAFASELHKSNPIPFSFIQEKTL